MCHYTGVPVRQLHCMPPATHLRTSLAPFAHASLWKPFWSPGSTKSLSGALTACFNRLCGFTLFANGWVNPGPVPRSSPIHTVIAGDVAGRHQEHPPSYLPRTIPAPCLLFSPLRRAHPSPPGANCCTCISAEPCTRQTQPNALQVAAPGTALGGTGWALCCRQPWLYKQKQRPVLRPAPQASPAYTCSTCHMHINCNRDPHHTSGC